MSHLPTRTTDPGQLAAALREIADRILAANIGELAAPAAVSVILHVDCTAGDDVQRAAVDQLASVTGQPADYTGPTERYAHYRTEVDAGIWGLTCTSFVRRPDEVDRLLAENEELRRRLVSQEATEVVSPPGPGEVDVDHGACDDECCDPCSAVTR